MKLKLVSDFTDYYDHAFDSDGRPFTRNSKGGPNRREMFQRLEAAGLTVPWHGVGADCPANIFWYVAYEDEKAHCGKGKSVKSRPHMLNLHPNTYCSEFLGDSLSTWAGTSVRFLFIGHRAFRLVYHSKDSWKSNCGNTRVLAAWEDDCPLWRRHFIEPLLAIDCVLARGKLHAIDLNVAPGLKGTGVEKILRPAELVLMLKAWEEQWSLGLRGF